MRYTTWMREGRMITRLSWRSLNRWWRIHRRVHRAHSRSMTLPAHRGTVVPWRHRSLRSHGHPWMRRHGHRWMRHVTVRGHVTCLIHRACCCVSSGHPSHGGHRAWLWVLSIRHGGHRPSRVLRPTLDGRLLRTHLRMRYLLLLLHVLRHLLLHLKLLLHSTLASTSGSRRRARFLRRTPRRPGLLVLRTIRSSTFFLRWEFGAHVWRR